jgi:hypothetical protein
MKLARVRRNEKMAGQKRAKESFEKIRRCSMLAA